MTHLLKVFRTCGGVWAVFHVDVRKFGSLNVDEFREAEDQESNRRLAKEAEAAGKLDELEAELQRRGIL